jgi:multiple sugar transport system substrate-binding protein
MRDSDYSSAILTLRDFLMQVLPEICQRFPICRISAADCRAGRDQTALIASLWMAFVLLAAIGCQPDTLPVPETSAVPRIAYTGSSLRIACDDREFAEAFTPLAMSWGGRVGVSVTVLPTGTMLDSETGADLLLIRPVEIGNWAAAGRLAGLPPTLRQANHPLHWDKLLEVDRKDLAGWGGQEIGLPVAGDGYVLVYRKDRLEDPAFRAKLQAALPHRPWPPRSWEGLADIAEFVLTTTSLPSLPGWPSDRGALLDCFQQIAACYDRTADSRGQVEIQGPARDVSRLAFHFDLETGQPRLTAPSFVAALDWLVRTQRFRGQGRPTSQVEALTTGTAVAGILSLAELAQLPRNPEGAIETRFGLAPIPGTESVFDRNGQKLSIRGSVNYVPFLGSNGWIGVVLRSSHNPQAAWDLLADCASLPGSLKLLGDARYGLGPFRVEHLYESRTWLPYHFDADRTRALTDALQRYRSIEVSDPVLALRIPRQAEFMAALAEELEKAIAGQQSAKEALQQAEAAWRRLLADVPEAKRLQWLRNAAALQ